MSERIMKSFRDWSRRDWSVSEATQDQVILGAMQRIADACEFMAKDHATLVAERDKYERWYREEIKYKEKATRSSIALRSVITRRDKEIVRLKDALAKEDKK
jgi:hypothetical protein